MFILYAIPAGILAGLAVGGRPDGLSTLQFRWAWVYLVGLAIQLALFSDYVSGWIGPVGMPIYVLSTLAVAAAIAANFRIRGMPIVLAGAVSNLAAIVANGGYMPSSPAALEAIGHVYRPGYSNSSIVAEPALPWLTDIFAMPSWLPAANVFSVGDILIGFGVIVVIASAMRAPAPAPTLNGPAADATPGQPARA
jgi:hypothetical protein